MRNVAQKYAYGYSPGGCGGEWAQADVEHLDGLDEQLTCGSIVGRILDVDLEVRGHHAVPSCKHRFVWPHNLSEDSIRTVEFQGWRPEI